VKKKTAPPERGASDPTPLRENQSINPFRKRKPSEANRVVKTSEKETNKRALTSSIIKKKEPKGYLKKDGKRADPASLKKGEVPAPKNRGDSSYSGLREYERGAEKSQGGGPDKAEIEECCSCLIGEGFLVTQ